MSLLIGGCGYRNVLVTTPEVVKLADFGLSRGLQDGDYYVGQWMCGSCDCHMISFPHLQPREGNCPSNGWPLRVSTSDDLLASVMSGCLVSLRSVRMDCLIN